MLRRLLLLSAGLLLAAATGIGWRAVSGWNAVRLPAIPPPAHELPPPCDERPDEIRVEWGGGLSWDEDVAHADAVIVASLTTQPPEIVQDAHCLWSTRYRFSVQDMVKGDMRRGENVWVRWVGRPIDVVIGFPKPRVGEQYVFFLIKRKHGDYGPEGGPHTTLRVIDGRLAPINQFHQRDGVPDSLEVLLTRLRRAAR
jgi:hypothetical protein